MLLKRTSRVRGAKSAHNFLAVILLCLSASSRCVALIVITVLHAVLPVKHFLANLGRYLSLDPKVWLPADTRRGIAVQSVLTTLP